MKKLITVFTTIFLLFVIVYHGIFARVNFGSGRAIKDRILPLARDIIRFGCTGLVGGRTLITSPNQIKQRMQQLKYPLIFSICFVIYASSLSYFFHHKEITDILGGIKSSIFPLYIFLSASFLGAISLDHQSSNKHKNNAFHTNNNKTTIYRTKKIIILLSGILILGFVRQGAKHLFPTFFHRLGYGPVGDRVAGQPAPLYYRTGHNGIPRLSGLFAGPNNYAYILILFFPFVLQCIKKNIIQKTYPTTKYKIFNTAFIIIFIISGLLTFSRGLLIARMTQIGIFFFYEIRIFIKQHSRIFRVSLFFVIGGIGGLSIYKSGSSIEHLQKRHEGIVALIQHPRWGYGLGSSGPGIHRGGSILPENTFLQILLDTGIFGFLLRVGSIWSIIFPYMWTKTGKRSIDLSKTTNKKNLLTHGTGTLFTLGLFGLLIAGMFLHVFEDGMVNYLFFVLWGLYYQKPIRE